MPTLGHPIVYTVPEMHQTKTVKGETVLEGSVHHPQLQVFSGLVTRVHDDNSADLVIFPPNRPPVSVDRAVEGEGIGTFHAL
jgi:hypothetical protein